MYLCVCVCGQYKSAMLEETIEMGTKLGEARLTGPLYLVLPICALFFDRLIRVTTVSAAAEWSGFCVLESIPSLLPPSERGGERQR